MTRASGSAAVRDSQAGRDIIAIGPGGQLSIHQARGPFALPLETAVIDLADDGVRSPALLLHARYGVVPFHATKRVTDELNAWLTTGPAFSLKVIGGVGGAGKTRAAVQLSRRSEQGRWVAGFLRAGATADEFDALARLAKPRLVIVDYAENRPNDLRRILPLFAEAAHSNHPLRLLLLVRGALGVSGVSETWSTVLKELGPEAAAIAASASPALDLDVQQLDAAARTILFETASAAFSKRLGKAPRPAPPVDVAAATPLFVTLHALLEVLGHDNSNEPTAVLDEALGHEERYWQVRADQQGVRFPDRTTMRRVVALATLTCAADQEEAVALLCTLPEYRDESSSVLVSVSRWAAHLYPGDDTYWSPLEPDLLGERLIARELGTDEALVTILQQSTSRRPVNVLARMDLTEAPAATVALLADVDRLGLSNLIRMSSGLAASPSPDTLAQALLATISASKTRLDRIVLSKIATASTVRFTVRVEAVERLVDQLRIGQPWREKDWPSGNWRASAVGTALLGLLASHPNDTANLLARWATDTKCFEPRDGTSRQDIARTVLTGCPELTFQLAEQLAESDPALLRCVLERFAKERPGELMMWANDWSHGSDPLALAALIAASKVAKTNADHVDEAARILRLLAEREWPGRGEALQDLGQSDPDDEAVRTRIVELVRSGGAPPWALRPYCEVDGRLVAQVLQERAVCGSIDECLDFLTNWQPIDNETEQQLLEICEVARAAGPETDLKLGHVAETALYAFNRGDTFSRGRCVLGVNLLTTLSESAWLSIACALSDPPSNDEFALFQLATVEQWRAAGARTDQLASLFSMSVATADRSGVDGWPSEDLLRVILAGMSPADVSEVLVEAAMDEHSAAQWLIQARLPSGVEADERLARFVNAYVESGDELVAYIAVTKPRSTDGLGMPG